MSTPDYWPQATRELADRDRVLARLIARYEGLALGSRGNAFSTLARAIVGQQISVQAAQSVWNRILARFGAIRPQALASARIASLRACGLSARKATYLRDLARRFADGSLEPRRWAELDDETLIGELTRVQGIGRWTAEMFLIFHLLRPDVFPLDDLGLRRAIGLHYGRGRPLSLARMRALRAVWAPWRSVATWYLWRSLDPVPVEY